MVFNCSVSFCLFLLVGRCLSRSVFVILHIMELYNLGFRVRVRVSVR